LQTRVEVPSVGVILQVVAIKLFHGENYGEENYVLKQRSWNVPSIHSVQSSAYKNLGCSYACTAIYITSCQNVKETLVSKWLTLNSHPGESQVVETGNQILCRVHLVSQARAVVQNEAVGSVVRDGRTGCEITAVDVVS
jgi:hypothetical protein